MRRPVTLTVAAMALSFATAAEARGQTRDVALAWSAVPGCADAASFERAFGASLGVSLAEHAMADTEIAVVFDDASGWGVSVEVRRGGVSLTRELRVQGPSCRELDEGLIVVVALLLLDVGREPVPIAPPIELSAAHGVERAALRGALALGASLRVDALPGLAVGPTLEGELRPIAAVTLGIAATYLPPMLSVRADGIGTEASAIGGALHGCVLGTLGALLELGGCGRVSAWAVTASGHGLSEARSSAGFALDATVALRAGLELARPLWLRAEVGLGLALVRARITYQLMGVIETFHVTSHAFPVAALFLEIRLGEA
jgi:hypothetical protein